MTIADLLGRIGLAFERTFYLVMLGALIVVVSFPIVLFVGAYVFGFVLIAIGSVLSRALAGRPRIRETPPR